MPRKPEPVYLDKPNYDADHPTNERGDLCYFEPSPTQQQYRDECDINNIMKGYVHSGLLPVGTTSTARYGDFSDVDDYLSAMLTLNYARDQFNELEANIRRRFNNDPAEFLDFVNNPDNKEEAQKLGLLAAEPPAQQPGAGDTTPPVTAPDKKPA